MFFLITNPMRCAMPSLVLLRSQLCPRWRLRSAALTGFDHSVPWCKRGPLIPNAHGSENNSNTTMLECIYNEDECIDVDVE